jgi:coenzyme F420 hydrogenase subunit beta
MCTRCGRCLAVCPGIHFGKTLSARWPTDPFVGEAREAFVGRALDDRIHADSQSGGVVTALLVHALRQNTVQAAVVTAMMWSQPPTVEPTVADTEYAVMAAQKSKYVPVPLLRALTQVKERGLTVAIVGLPCHMHGLHNLLDVRPELGPSVPLRIGLICDHIMTSAALHFLIRQSSLGSHATMVHFRDRSAGGYPGGVRVISADGRSVVVPSRASVSNKDALTPARCRLCFDKLNVFADLTVGDPWGIASADMVSGESVVITRTPVGSELVKRAVEQKAVALRQIPYGEVVKGQMVGKRRRDWRSYCDAWARLGHDLPDYYTRVAEHGPDGIKRGRYGRSLRRSLSLDRFRSREELFRHVDGQLRLQERSRKLLFPVRLCRGALGRMRRWVTRTVSSGCERARRGR